MRGKKGTKLSKPNLLMDYLRVLCHFLFPQVNMFSSVDVVKGG